MDQDSFAQDTGPHTVVHPNQQGKRNNFLNMDIIKDFIPGIKLEQIIVGLLQFVIAIISWSLLIHYSNEYYNNGRFHFKCNVTQSIHTDECYKQYENELNTIPGVTPLAYILFVGYTLLTLWILFGILLGNRLLQFKKRNQEDRSLKKSIYLLYCSHIVVRVVFIVLSLNLLWIYHKIELPSYFICNITASSPSDGNLTIKPINCSDLNSSDKTLINYGMLSINIFLAIVGMIELIFLSCKFKCKFPSDAEFAPKHEEG